MPEPTYKRPDPVSLGRALEAIEHAEDACFDAWNTVTSYLDPADERVSRLAAELLSVCNRARSLLGAPQATVVGRSLEFGEGTRSEAGEALESLESDV